MKYDKFSKVIISLVLGSLLGGCAAGAFVVGAAAGGAVVYDRRNIDTMRQDMVITHNVKKKLDYLGKGNRIVVSSFDHVVLLTGQVATEDHRTQAQQSAQQVAGIKQIYNEIAIAGPISALTQSSDTWITTKIKSQMLSKKDLHATQIKVITENGSVFLMGRVSRKQADKAVNIARRVSGVQRVVKIFEYS